MDRILDRLYIGDSHDVNGGTAHLRELGFVGVVDLRDGVRPYVAGTIPRFDLQKRDGDPWAPHEVEEALAFIHERVRLGRVLVACAAGMSRSVCICVGYLVRCGWDAASAYRHVRQARPQAAPVPAMLRSVLQVATVTDSTETKI